MKQDHTGLTISSCSYIGSGVPFHGRSSYEERFCGKTSRFNCNSSKSSENVLFSFFLHKTTKRYSYRKFFTVLSIILRLRKRGTEFLGNDRSRSRNYHYHYRHHHHHHHHYHRHLHHHHHHHHQHHHRRCLRRRHHHLMSHAVSKLQSERTALHLIRRVIQINL